MPSLAQYYSGSYPVAMYAHLATAPIGPPWDISLFTEFDALGYSRQPVVRAGMIEDPSGFVLVSATVTWFNLTGAAWNPAAMWIDGLAIGGNTLLAAHNLPSLGFGPIPPGQTVWNLLLKAWEVPDEF